ncbi:putative short-chain type dehydrogenase/reductase y4lA [Lasiodiplodia hormozganensis]|uniref:Short-chain type dehydrogenase/reductase y4lA n=1 Tax=Lasiodiplodia hormozganensis TaxID=869390 RepID=A0AA39Y5J5_9PEZI|nr:putative short-chain type dehydrogenase/reductase y4lA [Lasiodiplodia hormozganensis]
MTSTANVAGKFIAITGVAVGGIGFATAKLLAERGAHLSLADFNEQQLNNSAETLRKEFPHCKITTAVVDVRNEEQVEAWMKKTVDEFGKLDGAANVAGTTGTYVSSRTSIRTRGTWPWISTAAASSIVNVASVAGMIGSPTASSYGASKAAVVSLTKSAAREGGASGIRVNAVLPGVIDTPLSRESERMLGHPLPTKYQCLDRKGDPREVAALIAFLLSDDASFLTGGIYPADGGFLA